MTYKGIYEGRIEYPEKLWAHYQSHQEKIKLVRHQIGAVASLRNVVIIQRLPKIRSGRKSSVN